MKSLLFRLLAVALVAAGCSGAESANEDDQAVTVTVPDDESDGDMTETGQGSDSTGSALAFVATATEGELGFEVAPDAPAPTEIEVEAIPASGPSGTVGTDGVATVAYALWSWDGNTVERSSDTADRLSVILGEPSDNPPDAVMLPTALQQVLEDQPVGSRITALFPAGTAGLPRAAAADVAHVLVLDVYAFQTPEKS